MIVIPRQPVGSTQIKFPQPPTTKSPVITCPIKEICHAQQQLQQHQRRSPPRPSMPSLIERLPNELQRIVFSNLDYQSLIFLSTTNKHFHTAVKPHEMADPMEKFEFLVRAVKDFPQHRPSEKGQDHKPGNFECYICYRVRAPEYFDALQPQTAFFDPQGRVVSGREPGPHDRSLTLRRFCIECGVKEGLHASFDCLTTKTGQDLWVCRCRRVWAKPGCLKCPECGGDCPLRPKRKW